jgi:hypothetical protein
MQPNALAQGGEHVSTTAWKGGHFAVDTAGLLGRSDSVLGQPNTKPAEALVQDYDGLIRIAPATPSPWDFEGSVWVRDRTRVDVQVRAGVPTTVAIEAGSNFDTAHPQSVAGSAGGSHGCAGKDRPEERRLQP